MADITNLFKATVKAVKTRQKSQGLEIDKNHIFPHAKVKTEFSKKSKEVINSITQLRDFLQTHRKDYINPSSYIKSDKSGMTDAERDQIDEDAQSFMKTCSAAIQSLKQSSNENNVSEQTRDHRQAVFKLMDNYLKLVCKMYSEQRAIRVKRVVDRKRISRLEPEHKRSKKSELNEAKTDKETDIKDAETKDSEATTEPKRVPSIPVFDDDDSANEEELSPEEVQLFQAENEQLFEEMNSMVDEVRQIEGKVVEISRLQEIFTEKVLEQEKDIDRIADTVVSSTENIKDANEEIREAMKNNAGFRVWILFFLVVLTFSLLFLDWYNN
ncbi:unnamed protein product [Owenia fusiformis]|uniref:Syntaxin-18 n=1 Tax=Owenia fusiformis TaxID=6347 RepID=A0A8J1TZ23_OWEFU|nr:unnamed protein product [Owenia fusiformis]